MSRDGLWKVDVRTGDEERLTDGPDTEPSWSPDERWIVFRRGADEETDLYLVWRRREDVRRLTDASGREVLPFGSPKGVE